MNDVRSRAPRSLLFGFIVVASAAASPLACSSSPPEDTSAPPLTGDASPANPGRDGATAGDTGSPRDAGEDREGGSTLPGPPPPRCADLVTDGGAGGRLATLDAPDLARFDGVTSVLLAIAWTNAAGDVWVGDRGDPFSGFDGAKVGSAIAAPGARVALAATGNAVVVASGATLTAYTRTRPGAVWSGPASGPYAAVNAWLTDHGASPAEPVLGSSGRTLFFLSVPNSGAPALVESAWDEKTSAWAAPVAHPEIASEGAARRRRPTGVAWDDLTLFYWDEVAQIERAATRDTPAGAFTRQTDVGPFPEAAPDQPCRLLYYQGTDGSGAGVFSTSGAL